MALNGIYERFWLDINETGTNRICSVFWDDVGVDFVVKSWVDFNSEQIDASPQFHTFGKKALSTDIPYLEMLVTQRESPFINLAFQQLY